MKIIIEEEKTDSIGNKWSKYTNDEIDMHSIDLWESHEIFSQN